MRTCRASRLRWIGYSVELVPGPVQPGPSARSWASAALSVYSSSQVRIRRKHWRGRTTGTSARPGIFRPSLIPISATSGLHRHPAELVQARPTDRSRSGRMGRHRSGKPPQGRERPGRCRNGFPEPGELGGEPVGTRLRTIPSSRSTSSTASKSASSRPASPPPRCG